MSVVITQFCNEVTGILQNKKNSIHNLNFIIIIILQRYGPFSLALASLIIDAHSSLSNAFTLHRFTPSFLKSSSTSSVHLSLGHPLPLLPSNFPSKIFFTDLVSFILITIEFHTCQKLLKIYAFVFAAHIHYNKR